jgi:hypothetical protein
MDAERFVADVGGESDVPKSLVLEGTATETSNVALSSDIVPSVLSAKLKILNVRPVCPRGVV